MKNIFTTALFIILTGVLSLFGQERIYTPTLSLPANGATGQMPNVLLDWDAVTGGNTGNIQYEVNLSDEPTFTNPTVFQTDFITAVATSQLKFGSLYYWRVRAIDGIDVSGWSDTWSFRVMNKITLSKPVDFVDEDTNPKLEWVAVTGINEYDYQLDTTYFWNILSPVTSINFSAVAMVDASHIWAVGAGGKVFFFDGTTWTEQVSNTSNDLYAVSFFDNSNGIAVGKGGTVIRFADNAWATQTSGTTNDLNGVSFVDSNNGWAVGKSGTVQFFNGLDWSSSFTASKDLYDVYFMDMNNGWACGKGGVIIHYDGTGWSVQESGSTRDFNSIWFTGANTGWAVGKGGAILQFNDGSWSPYGTSLTTKDLYTLSFTDPSNGWAVGKSGVLLQYDGLQWTIPSSGTDANLNGVSFAGPENGLIVGDAGMMIKYNTEGFTSPMAVIYSIPGTTPSKQLNDMLFGTKYFWRVRAKHPTDVSAWSAARCFNTVAKVTLDKPNDASTGQNLDVLLKWKKASDNIVYDIEIDEDPNFIAPIELSTEAIQINATGLRFGILYNWRVRAYHSLDTSAWSTVWTFTTGCSITLTSPADGSIDIKTTPILTWDPFTGIEQYNVQLDKNNSFTVPIVNDLIAATSSTYSVPIVLEKNTTYYWRVRAVNGLDSSCWSPSWSFTTIPPLGIDVPGNAIQINIYPNPVIDQVWVEVGHSGNDPVHVSIHDILGKSLIERNLILNGTKTESLDVSKLANGIYLFKVIQAENSLTKKIIINR